MEILPIGTVVQVGINEDLLMITTRFPLTIEKGIKGYYDYAACLYPIGIDVNSDPFLFNHEDISQVFFEGYINSLEEKLKEHYLNKLNEIPYPKFSIHQ